jgi:site-specific recombinase XerD
MMTPMDVREAVQEFLHAKHTLSRETQRGYRIRLAAFVTWCEEQGLPLEALTARHIRTFIDAISKRKGIHGDPVQSSTVRLYALTVKVFLSWCMKEEDEDFMISPEVVTRIQLPKADRRP